MAGATAAGEGVKGEELWKVKWNLKPDRLLLRSLEQVVLAPAGPWQHGWRGSLSATKSKALLFRPKTFTFSSLSLHALKSP